MGNTRLITKNWEVYDFTEANLMDMMPTLDLEHYNQSVGSVQALWPVLYSDSKFQQYKDGKFLKVIMYHIMEIAAFLLVQATDKGTFQALRYAEKGNAVSSDQWTTDTTEADLMQRLLLPTAVWLANAHTNQAFYVILPGGNSGGWQWCKVAMEDENKKIFRTNDKLSSVCKVDQGVMFSEIKCEKPWDDPILQGLCTYYYLYLFGQKQVYVFDTDAFEDANLGKHYNMTTISYANFLKCGAKSEGAASSGPNVGLIVGIVILVIVVLAVLLLALYCIVCGHFGSGRKRKPKSSRHHSTRSKKSKKGSSKKSSRKASSHAKSRVKKSKR